MCVNRASNHLALNKWSTKYVYLAAMCGIISSFHITSTWPHITFFPPHPLDPRECEATHQTERNRNVLRITHAISTNRASSVPSAPKIENYITPRIFIWSWNWDHEIDGDDHPTELDSRQSQCTPAKKKKKTTASKWMENIYVYFDLRPSSPWQRGHTE